MGAVNTVVFRDGRAAGHNTDGSGWRWGFERTLPSADLSRVVLLGAGGAGSAIAHAVVRLGAVQLVVVDATHAPGAAAEELNSGYGRRRVSGGPTLAEALAGASGLIHATPTGMDKLPGLPLPAELLRPDLWVAEIVYFPLDTALLQAARAAGLRHGRRRHDGRGSGDRCVRAVHRAQGRCGARGGAPAANARPTRRRCLTGLWGGDIPSALQINGSSVSAVSRNAGTSLSSIASTGQLDTCSVMPSAALHGRAGRAAARPRRPARHRAAGA